MWGYDRDDEADFTFVPYKTEDEHFALFCLALERGFALHTGSAGRLLTEFSLSDAGESRYLPKVEPRGSLSYRVPESLLKPSGLFLYYDPDAEYDVPQLAYFDAQSSHFLPYSPELAAECQQQEATAVLPLVKLATLRGLHYSKDIACLQLFELDFERLARADNMLVQHLREILGNKLEAFFAFSQPWLSASRNEALAQAYLNGGQSGVRRLLSKGVDATVVASADASPFLTWENA